MSFLLDILLGWIGKGAALVALFFMGKSAARKEQTIEDAVRAYEAEHDKVEITEDLRNTDISDKRRMLDKWSRPDMRVDKDHANDE